MAEQSKPGQGVIVRADFGGGIDESMDAWRVPPSQLSDLRNGRLEKVGSVRKRTGYQPIDPPKPSGGSASAGEPIAAFAAAAQTVVVDRARDSSLDDWKHLFPTTPQRIANESGYVARQYTPSTTPATNGWTTTGPASDVIGDVFVLDGNAGDIDECVDYGAAENFVFVVKVTRSSSAASASTFTLSQYDATTFALVSELSQTFAGGAPGANAARIYPKLIVYPSLNRIVVAIAHNHLVNKAQAVFHLYSYGAAGLAFVTTPAVTPVQNAVDHFDVTAYATVPEQRYRPACPWDVCKVGTDGLFLATFDTGVGTRTERFTVSASTITSTAQVDHPVGIGPLQALSIAETSAGVALVGYHNPLFNAALTPPYQAGNYGCPMATYDATTCALVAANLFPITISVAGSVAIPGRLTVGEYQAQDATESRVCGFVEVLEYATGFIYAHRLVRVGMGFGNVTATDSTTFKSYAIPAGRLFSLTYHPTVPSTDRRPLRLPLVVGASQQTFLGRVALSNDPYTEYAGNYSGVIGTQLLVGTEEMTLGCVNGPVQTYAPRLQPCPPPSAFLSQGKWCVPHLVALDGGSGFGIAMVRLAQRAPGDVQPSAYATLPMFPAGVLQQADGERFAEVTLVDRPIIGAVVGSNSGTANDFTQGDYLIQCVASYRDAYGNVHRSTPSDPYRMVSVASPLTSRTWTIYFGYQSYTNRNNVQLDFYVTEPNGTILRYWFSVPNVLLSVGWASVARSDSAVSGGTGLPPLDAPTLYTTGGVLPYVPVPSSRFAVLFKNRLIVGGSDDRRSIYYSNAPLSYQGASFAVGNVLRIEHETGATAAGALGDKLILFTENSVWAIFGQFRDQTGAGDAISEPEQIHDYIGCTQPASVVSVSTGLIFFGTDSRFYLIDDRLGLVPIGLRVQTLTRESMLERYDEIQAAVHIEGEREVRFFMRESASGSIGILVYNYQVDQWSLDRVTLTNQPFIGSWGAACWSPSFGVLAMTNADWVKDDGTTWKDGTSWITLTASTAWIQPAGTQDYSRFRYAQVLGRSVADHNLTVTVRVDFDENTTVATGTWTAAQLAPIASTVYPEQVRLQVGTQKTQAVKITIADAAPSGATNGRGPQLVGLALEMLPLGGMRRLPDVRKK
jgi:hypothetical protein